MLSAMLLPALSPACHQDNARLRHLKAMSLCKTRYCSTQPLWIEEACYAAARRKSLGQLKFNSVVLGSYILAQSHPRDDGNKGTKPAEDCLHRIRAVHSCPVNSLVFETMVGTLLTMLVCAAAVHASMFVWLSHAVNAALKAL